MDFRESRHFLPFAPAEQGVRALPVKRHEVQILRIVLMAATAEG